jgi:predicted  nucleic acid-binding Zn-ribbon protein
LFSRTDLLAFLAVDVDELEKSLESVREELSAATTARTTLEQEKSSLEIKVNALQTRADAADASTAALEEQISTLQRSAKDKDQAIERLEAGQTKDIVAANELARERDEKLRLATRQASKSERELKSIIAQGDERHNEVENLRQAIARLEEEISRSRSGAAGTTVEANGLADELERKVNEVEALRQELEQQREAVAEANSALAELRELYSQATDEIEAQRAAGSPSSPVPSSSTTASATDLDNLRLELSTAQGKIRSLEQELFSLESTKTKMLKANGDLKGQIESMMEALDQERTKLKAKELEFDGAKSRAASFSSPPPAPRQPLPAATPDAFSPAPSTSSLATPPRRAGGHAHRRTASLLPSASDLTLPSISELSDPTSAPPPLFSPPLVPLSSYSSGAGGAQSLDAALARSSSPNPPHHPSSSTGPSATRQHMRAASLSLLKQRMEDEYGVHDLDAAGPLSPTRENAGLGASPARRRATDGRKTPRVPLSNDLIWCTSCRGDIFVL